MGSPGKTYYYNDITSDSLEEQHRQMESTQWQVNPIKVKLNDPAHVDGDDFMRNKEYYDVDEDPLRF